MTAILEDGRYAIACVKARVAGEPLPAKRPPVLLQPGARPLLTRRRPGHPPAVCPDPSRPVPLTQNACLPEPTRTSARSRLALSVCPIGRAARRTRHGLRATTAAGAAATCCPGMLIGGFLFGGMGNMFGGIGDGVGDLMGGIGDGVSDIGERDRRHVRRHVRLDPRSCGLSSSTSSGALTGASPAERLGRISLSDLRTAATRS